MNRSTLNLLAALTVLIGSWALATPKSLGAQEPGQACCTARAVSPGTSKSGSNWPKPVNGSVPREPPSRWSSSPTSSVPSVR